MTRRKLLKAKSINIRKGIVYGKASYGKASYRKASFRKASYGKASYGKASYTKASYGKASYGKVSYGKASYGKASYTRASYGKASYRKASYMKKIEFESRAHPGSCDNLFEMVRYGFRARSSLFVPTGHLYSVLKACLNRDFTAAGKYLKPRESGIEALCGGLRDALRDAFPYDAFVYDAFPYDAFVYDTFPYDAFLNDAFLYNAFPYDAFTYIKAFRL